MSSVDWCLAEPRHYLTSGSFVCIGVWRSLDTTSRAVRVLIGRMDLVSGGA